MQARRTRRTRGIVAASLAVHAVLLAILAVQSPHLPAPQVASGPPEAVIPVLIMPRTPPASSTAPGSQPQPIRLHRRPQRFAPDEKPPVAPLVAPVVETKAPAPSAPGPRPVTGPPPEDAVSTNARQVLRGKLGCANASLMGLSRAEREACEDQLAAGARQADYLGTGMDADKAKGFAAIGRRKEADYTYMRSTPKAGGGMGPSAAGSAVGRYNLPGQTSEQMSPGTGNDKPTARVPF